MPIYNYVIMDHESWFIKHWQIKASTAQVAWLHLEESNNTVMVSENKIPTYKNKELLSAQED